MRRRPVAGKTLDKNPVLWRMAWHGCMTNGAFDQPRPSPPALPGMCGAPQTAPDSVAPTWPQSFSDPCSSWQSTRVRGTAPDGVLGDEPGFYEYVYMGCWLSPLPAANLTLSKIKIPSRAGIRRRSFSRSGSSIYVREWGKGLLDPEPHYLLGREGTKGWVTAPFCLELVRGSRSGPFLADTCVEAGLTWHPDLTS